MIRKTYIILAILGVAVTITVVILGLNFTKNETDETVPIEPSNCEMPWEWNVIYVDYSIDWNDIGTDIKAATDACFNVIIISFWISGRLADAAQVWGQTMSEQQRQSALDYAHHHGARVILAGGGATENIENKVASHEGREYGKSLAEDAIKYGFDGVDFDLELKPGNNQPFYDGTMQEFLLAASHAAREILGPDRVITHAPQAPYLGTWAGPGFGYTELMKDPSCEIDFVSIQFYSALNNFGPTTSI